MTVAFKKNSMPAIRIVLFLLVLSNGCRMLALEKDTTAEYELSPEMFFADPGKPVMSAKDIAYSEQQGASGAWLDNLKIPAFWQINGGINRKSLPLTLDFSGKRLRFSSPGSLSFYLRPAISPNHRYLLRFTMEGQGTVKAGYFTYPMPGKKGLSQMKEYRCTPDSSVITVEEVLDPTTEMGHRYFRLMFILSGELTLRDFCLKRLPLPEGETIAEGHLEVVSKLPVPEKSDYPDCYFTAKIRLEKILSGKPVPQDMQLVIPGFYGRKATEYAKFKSGDIVRVKLVKFDSLDDKRKSIQQADDLNIFDLENYFVIGAAKTNAVSPGENVIDLIQNKRSAHRKMQITEALIRDDSGYLKVIWFNQSFITRNLKVGDEISLAGRVQDNYGQMQMTSPDYEKIKAGDLINTNGLIPNYHSTSKLSQKQIRFLIKQILPLAEKVEDWLPADLRNRLGLIDLKIALRNVHFPISSNKRMWRHNQLLG